MCSCYFLLVYLLPVSQFGYVPPTFTFDVNVMCGSVATVHQHSEINFSKYITVVKSITVSVILDSIKSKQYDSRRNSKFMGYKVHNNFQTQYPIVVCLKQFMITIHLFFIIQSPVI